ncbi:LysR family transcriptional regulator [Paraburkholderia silvatlantica]|uniref:DNA-binding transcriptional LysR family regulator n=1 Tax=Paraburkholderia silvatlantica TaxID=321895 RepID=A0ABR6FV43_9BURK|nr:LysR family transcriptional regulator [Paraburkholderia silvatlantica]MBB2931253.1 DNA-binding transcriptional LysR family regulator [Paraburkholderia silvatlantica]PVY28306.1 LysR family transcriptional regulator [Paraburkholderia silvatlantica]PXW34991.1 LysR family transcriptional regulator [Paraburkholderia silvatlantica]TDQ98898.1 LysR family transcriptional regulator [Paraburkholderia silvatlantica]
MELRHLRYFLVVADEQNFTRAAGRLGIGQPPLSMQIKDLEQEVGAVLFQRTSRGVFLTEAGEAFLPEARQALEAADNALHAARRASRGDFGKLRIGFTGSAAFNRIVSGSIRKFRRVFSGVEVVLEEHNTNDLIERLQNMKLDTAFIRPGITEPHGLVLNRLPDEPMKILLPTTHRLSKHKKIPIAALSAESFVFFPRSVGPALHDEIIKACQDSGFEPILGQQAPQMSSVVNLVAAGFGISIVPSAIAQIQADGVKYIDIDGEGPRARLALAKRQDMTSAVLGNFIKIVAS